MGSSLTVANSNTGNEAQASKAVNNQYWTTRHGGVMCLDMEGLHSVNATSGLSGKIENVWVSVMKVF